MIYLSESEKSEARTTALTVLTENANRLLADRTASEADKLRAISALMAFEWTPATAKSIGSKSINRLLQVVRSGIFPAGEYRTVADMIVRACDPSLPILTGQCGLWKSVIIRFHLYEISGRRDWECLIDRVDSRGIHSPLHLAKVPFVELIKADMELPNTDMLVWIWHAVRGDSSPYRPNLPLRLDSPSPDLQNLIYAIRKKDIESTKIITDYEELKSSRGLDTSFEGLSTSGKCDMLTRPGDLPDGHTPDTQHRCPTEHLTGVFRFAQTGRLWYAKLQELSRLRQTAVLPG